MQKRKIEDEQHAQACLAEVAESGQSLAAWCREHGIDSRSLNSWRINLGRRAGRREGAATQGRTPRFVELVARTANASPSARYAVVLGDVRIEVDGEVRAETIARLVAALRAC